MKHQLAFRIIASLLCLAGPILYHAFLMPAYVYLISLVGVLALLFMDRRKNKNSRKRDENI